MHPRIPHIAAIWLLLLLFTAGSADSAARPLFRCPTGPADPAWSPNGKEIAFSQQGREQVAVWNLKTHVLRTVASGFGASWSPDGTRIAYAAYRPLVFPVHGGCVSPTNPEVMVVGASSTPT